MKASRDEGELTNRFACLQLSVAARTVTKWSLTNALQTMQLHPSVIQKTEYASWRSVLTAATSSQSVMVDARGELQNYIYIPWVNVFFSDILADIQRQGLIWLRTDGAQSCVLYDLFSNHSFSSFLSVFMLDWDPNAAWNEVLYVILTGRDRWLQLFLFLCSEACRAIHWANYNY